MHHDQVPMDARSIEGIENLPLKLRPCPDCLVEPGLFVRVQNKKIGVGTEKMVAILNVFRVVPIIPIRLQELPAGAVTAIMGLVEATGPGCTRARYRKGPGKGQSQPRPNPEPHAKRQNVNVGFRGL
jgi:hypothetical protein